MIKIEEFNKGKNGNKVTKYYIAYGSNMDLNQMSYRVRDSVFIGTGYLEDYKLEFKSRYATIEEERNSRVPVVIFKISEEDEKQLDRYEGYPELYYKKEVRVKLNNLEEIDCIVYIMEEKYNHYQLPEVNYYLNMELSYKIFGFELEILERALVDSYRHIGNKGNKVNRTNKTNYYRLIIINEEDIEELYESEDIESLLVLMEEIKNLDCYISDEEDDILYFKEEGIIYKN